MTTLEYPIGLEISAREAEDGLWELYFKEFFPKGQSKDVVERSVEIVSRLGYGVEIGENSLSYTVKKPKTQVFDILAGEFLAMSNLGNQTLGEIFATMAIIAAEAKR